MRSEINRMYIKLGFCFYYFLCFTIIITGLSSSSRSATSSTSAYAACEISPISAFSGSPGCRGIKCYHPGNSVCKQDEQQLELLSLFKWMNFFVDSNYWTGYGVNMAEWNIARAKSKDQNGSYHTRYTINKRFI